MMAQVVLPALLGLLTGAAVGALSTAAEGLALPALASLPDSWPALFSPLALLVTLLVVRFVTRASHPSTAELYVVTYHQPHGRLPLAQVPGRILGGCTTVGFGGSQGLESPSALLGASVSQILGSLRAFSLGEEAKRTLLSAGAGAGIAAVFSSPGVGTLYGMEIPWRRDVDAPRLIPCAIAAACAYGARAALVGPVHLVSLHRTPVFDERLLAGALLVAVGAGLAARLFALGAEAARTWAGRHRPLIRALVAGLVLGGLALSGHLLTDRWVTFGPGYVAADWLFSGEHAWALLGVVLVVRTAGTLICVYGGGGGGVFTSLALTGAFVGEIVARALGRADDALALLGAACVLGAAYRIPLATMLYVAESGGGVALSMLGIGAVAIAQALLGDRSVSDAQRDTRTSPAGAGANARPGADVNDPSS